MTHLRNMAKSLTRATAGFQIEEERLLSPEDILSTGDIEEVTIVKEIGSSLRTGHHHKSKRE